MFAVTDFNRQYLSTEYQAEIIKIITIAWLAKY